MANGLGSFLGWSDNPYYQHFDQRRNAIGQLGAGLLAGRNLQEGLALGAQGALAGRQVDDANTIRAKQEQDRLDNINETVNWMRQNGMEDLAQRAEAGGMEQAWAEALRRTAPPDPLQPTANMRDFEFAQANPGFADFIGNGSSSSSAGQLGTTIYTGRDANGNIVPMQVGQGGFVQSQLPDGVTFDPGALNAERAAGNVTGKGAGQAALDLPSAVTEAQKVAIQIEDLKSHPGLDEIFGKTLGVIPNQWGPTFPGTKKADAMARIEQMSGNAFLNGRQLLKGGGAITDMESNKAEAAFARLSTAQTKEEFIKGLDEFNAALIAGVQKLQMQSGGTIASGNFGTAPATNTTSSGLSWSIEP